jgi:hypothetical protein
MSDKHLEPARSIIAVLDGVERVSIITGKHVTRVYRWMYPKERGGTGGSIPYEEATKLLQYARDNDVDLRGDDFFDAARLQALLASEAEAGAVA